MNNKGLFITATDTDVGKTEVAAALAAFIKSKSEHENVNLWKPVQSGVIIGDPNADSYRLLHGSGLDQQEKDIATYTFPKPLAPWVAAKREGKEIDFSVLVEEGLKRLENSDFLITEGAGGLIVPIAENKTIADLASELKLPLIIVARAGLGTVNHTCLSISYARTMGLEVKGVILNGYLNGNDPALKENITMIENFGRVPVLGKLPWLDFENEQGIDWTARRQQWMNLIEKHLDLKLLF
ncbi:dethiobiotin synthase [Chengkuizengella axinellae]|uniref:ATP-dependent dethiobiotin synthetase BioD n=1 Tax=Chengkuizengella axinellae TaxID=3064388 RepID=A0ABT9J062_9BACL|nr:dethiobiotin synthase [Chengkuizengella sp. 2205SS18-9]MDP5274962.1 dethiobiotin synthase [Chengkuizengella sp. 2205SS18-9]